MVSIQAALDNVADIAVKSHGPYCQYALVLGISVIIKPINVNPNTYRLSWWIMLFSSLLYGVSFGWCFEFNRRVNISIRVVLLYFFQLDISYSGDTLQKLK